jgi:hypothetical protein
LHAIAPDENCRSPPQAGTGHSTRLIREKYFPLFGPAVQPIHPACQLNTLETTKENPMKKILLLSSILLLSAVWAVAQYDSQTSASQSSSDSSKTTVEGCLAGSNGSFSLTDKSGTMYQLTGDTAKLDKHVGHTIQVTGTTTTSSASTTSANSASGAMSGSADMQQTFSVTSFKHVSANCNDMHNDMHKDMHNDMH